MSEPAAGLDEPTLKIGLLMESAQTHQRLAESQLDALRVHTRDLDSVVREQIRRSLAEELQGLSEETTRVTLAIRRAAQQARWRTSLFGLLPVLLCAAMPFGIAHWVVPSEARLAEMQTREAALAANLTTLEQRGAKTTWRRCGAQLRLCVRVDKSAPVYGEQGDFYVLEGY